MLKADTLVLNSTISFGHFKVYTVALVYFARDFKRADVSDKPRRILSRS